MSTVWWWQTSISNFIEKYLLRSVFIFETFICDVFEALRVAANANGEQQRTKRNEMNKERKIFLENDGKNNKQ